MKPNTDHSPPSNCSHGMKSEVVTVSKPEPAIGFIAL